MIASAPVRLTEKSGLFPGLPELLSKAVKDYDLPAKPDWRPLAELSNKTVFEGIEVFGDASIVEGTNLIAPANVYVRLTYDLDDSQFADSYPARVFFSVESGEDKKIRINKIEVDTSTFYR